MHFASIQCSKMRLRPGLLPGPRWDSLQRSPDPLAGFQESASQQGGEAKKGEGRRGSEREKRNKDGGEGEGTEVGIGPTIG